MPYLDGFVLPISKKKIKAYLKLSKMAGKVWRDHGALEYREACGDDLKIMGLGSFLKAMKCKPGETVFFSWIVYKSRAHRDRVNAKVMKDDRIQCTAKAPMPFDVKRMLYGGFKVLVDE